MVAQAWVMEWEMTKWSVWSNIPHDVAEIGKQKVPDLLLPPASSVSLLLFSLSLSRLNHLTVAHLHSSHRAIDSNHCLPPTDSTNMHGDLQATAPHHCMTARDTSLRWHSGAAG